ncbi:enoyl-CoA hydratase family protein [Longispora albida]|uniref:enoyl-CoA hydratase family protein n=1 Tax=Longispora albida TaxID=203523 RepID=UPI0003723728|nr:enoyl-CoA hydratase family protein [Longispora albida]
MAEELVRYSAEQGVATLTLDSPANRNALSTALISDFIAAIDRAEADDSVRALLLDHTGPVFCSGADLKETAAAREAGQVPAAALVELLARLVECPKPVVARVNGPARAGGLGLIAAADIAVCSASATFAFTEVRLGVVPAVISATVLPRLTSRAAAELYLTGAVFDGERAAGIGLVTAAVSDVDATVRGYLDALVLGAPGALAGAKALLRRPVREELDRLATLSASYFLSPEGREGVQAFAEKRAPSWVPEGRWPK